VPEQGYLAPPDHGAGSSCRSLYAQALMSPPKLTLIGLVAGGGGAFAAVPLMGAGAAMPMMAGVVGVPPGAPGAALSTVLIRVPLAAVGSVIGKGGANIQQVRWAG
jgi:hypothetical protein